MIDAGQLREHLIKPILKRLDMNSTAAQNLLLGTAAQESRMGTYLVQLGDGPAKGIFQMEPATHDDIIDNFIRFKPAIKKVWWGTRASNWAGAEQLVFNTGYAALMARLHYYRRPEPLPDPDDIEGLAHYWKDHYNTSLGKGTVEEFIENYKRYVLCQG